MMKTTKKFQIYAFDPTDPQRKISTRGIDGLTRETAEDLYYKMLRLRLCEEALIKEYHPADEMKCPVHFCVGQEAVPAALSLLTNKQDYVFSHHRSHGYYFSKDAPMRTLFAELYGRESGASGGRAGSQDISSSKDRFYSGAILAGAIPIAVGAAQAAQNKKGGFISISGFGEGATDEGVFWEAINFAAVKKLPVVFLCENNKYATYSPQEKRSVSRNIAERVQDFGVPSTTIFGNDVVDAYKTIKDAVEKARNGEGPTFVEAFTFRWNGHVGPENDDQIGYRPQEEIKWWKDHCPISLFEKKLFEASILDAKKKKALVQKIETEISDAFSFAKKSAFPKIADFASCNFSGKRNLAEKFLETQSGVAFDESQAELIPAPY